MSLKKNKRAFLKDIEERLGHIINSTRNGATNLDDLKVEFKSLMNKQEELAPDIVHKRTIQTIMTLSPGRDRDITIHALTHQYVKKALTAVTGRSNKTVTKVLAKLVREEDAETIKECVATNFPMLVETLDNMLLLK